MSTFIAILESEQHWRALSRKQAVFRSFFFHSLVWTSLIFVGARCAVPQFRDAGFVFIELQSPQHAPLAASTQGRTLTQLRMAPPSSTQASSRPSKIAKTPTVDSRRSIRVAAVHARHAAVISRAAGSFTHMRKPGQSAPTMGPAKPVPAGATVATGLTPQPSPQSLHSSAGTHLSRNPGIMAQRELPVDEKSTFAEMDARACKLYFEGESLSAKDPIKAMKNWSEALVIMQEAVPLLKREVGANHSEVAFATWNLGRCYEKVDELDKAVECYRDAANLQETVLGRNSLQRAITLVHLSDALKKQSKYLQAKTALLASFPAYEVRYGVDSAEVGWSHTRLTQLESLLDDATTSRRTLLDLITLRTAAPSDVPAKVIVRYAPARENFYYVPAAMPGNYGHYGDVGGGSSGYVGVRGSYAGPGSMGGGASYGTYGNIFPRRTK